MATPCKFPQFTKSAPGADTPISASPLTCPCELMSPRLKEAPVTLTICAASSQVAPDPRIAEIGVHGKWAVKLAPLALSVQWMVLSTASFLSLQMTETATLA